MARFDEVLESQLGDVEVRAYWERTALARAVANAVVQYRTAHSMSQRALAAELGWKPSQVARLELGEHNPSMETLSHLTTRLGLRFSFDIRPAGPAHRMATGTVEDITTRDGNHILVRAG